MAYMMARRMCARAALAVNQVNGAARPCFSRPVVAFTPKVDHFSNSILRRSLSTSSSAEAKHTAFKIQRTRSGNLPVYLDYRKGRTMCITIVRRVKGNHNVLASELQRLVGHQHAVKVKEGSIEIVGDHKKEVSEALEQWGAVQATIYSS
mmetsp:Transcript_32715/g.52986  ORF Transcript_32715/g.52986 Transcript_32715/m.52986 type:complete len:150 (+) Transcript_32715:23-472(+)